ncbi:MAG: carbonic anhydrase [Simkaniaceae bacterium]
MKMFSFFSLFFLVANLCATTPSEALEKLKAGNQRFQKNKSQSQNLMKRKELKQVQAPFAVIVACSDSRVAPELLFDQGIGDLFVVRVAGNVLGPLEMESIEYAVKYLGSSLVFVMGHENCGAVNAVVQGETDDIRFIAQLIKSSVVKAKAEGSNQLLKRAIELNAETMSRFIMQSSILDKEIKADKLAVYPAYYHFNTGEVEILKNPS